MPHIRLAPRPQKPACMQGVIKAMLQSPTANQGGFSDLFTSTDLNRLKTRDNQLMARVKDAEKSIEMMFTFLKAFGKFSPKESDKLCNMMEVRAIMHAWNKKAGTRASYSSQAEVMQSVIVEARSLYPSLPDMPMLGEIAKKKGQDSSSASNIIQVGTVENAVLEEKGFKVGATIKNEDRRFKITCLNIDLKNITVVAYCEEEEDFGDVSETIKRADLAAFIVEQSENQVFHTDYPSPSDNVGLLKSIIHGAVSQAILKEFFASSENHCLASQIGKTVTILSKKKVERLERPSN